MKTSYKWLLELTGIDWSADEVAERLTLCGTACEYVDPMDQYMGKVIVAEILELNPIPGADKIKNAIVDIGSEKMEVVCGAPNVAIGQKVPLAMLGAKLAGGIEIKKAKIRGIESSAMICSERELGISDDHTGILVLDENLKPGTPVAEALDYKDYQMTFEITPNRGDSMSAIGIARDLAALGNTKLKYPEVKINEVDDKAADQVAIKIEDTEGCPRYAARVIRNVKIGESPAWMKTRLRACGMRPISNLVDITNYVMMETGHPLHAFDFDRFGSKEVVVRKAKAKEKFSTLDGNEHELAADQTMITNGKEPVAAGGVMGGLNSEVADSTTNILLEAAYFNPGMIRRSRRHLGLVTESSMRFEKGADPNNVEYAINRAAYLLQELCGGEVLSGIVDCYPNKIEPKVVQLRPARCNKILGSDFSDDQVEKALTGLEYEVKKGEPWQVTVPTYRTDVEREIDLIEEVGRIIGYDNIPEAVSNVGPLYQPIHEDDWMKSEVSRELRAAGFDEIVNHGLVDSREAALLTPEIENVRISNPSSEDLNAMRTSLMHSCLKIVAHNIAFRSLDLRLFELGKVYFQPDADDNWVEEERLMVAITGSSRKSWRDNSRPFDFYDLLGGIEHLRCHFKWPDLTFKAAKYPFFTDKIAFDLEIAGGKVGWLGEIDRKILAKFEIKQPLFVAELSLNPLIKASNRIVAFAELPIYPAAPRDLAMVVDQTVRAGDIVSKVKKTAGPLAESVEIFDLYMGKQIEQGKKSIAISINYRSRERNLASEEVDAMQADVIAALAKDFNAVIRDK